MIKSYIVDETCNDMRLDRWIRNTLGNIPQSLIEKNLRAGKIKVNNKKVKSSFKIKTGFEIQSFNLNFKENILQKKIKYQPSDQVIKENENLIIDDNENFIVLKKNLVDIFAKSKVFKNSKPYSVHRLDKDTSGVFIMAKNRETAQLLTSLFRLRKVYKTYLAICHGELESNKGEWISDLIRYDNGKKVIENARTLFRVIDKNSLCSLVEMKPITGRKHQLRKQLYEIGHSIFGDTKYRNSEFAKGINKNLMLHSYQIKFMINNKKYTYTALLPEYFKKLLKIKRLNFSG